MSWLSSIETPLAMLISVVFLVRGLFNTVFKIVESNQMWDENALDTRDMLMSSLAVMSIIGICSSRRAFGVFTLTFMLHASFFTTFHVFHHVTLVNRSIHSPCRYHPTSSDETTCAVSTGATLVCLVVSMIGAGLASMAVFVRLTTIIVPISDMRSLATSRSFDNTMPRLISRVSVESERENFELFKHPNQHLDCLGLGQEQDPEEEEVKLERKIGKADLFV